jgi:hypothetical protein
VGVRKRVPDLLLTRVVVGDRERHQLLQRHRVFGIEIEELGRDRGELEPLLDHGRADEEARGDVFFAEPLVAQGLEGAELVERVKRDALHVLGQRILLGEAFGAHHARHGLRLRHALLLHQQLKRAVAPAAGRNFVHAGLGAVGIAHRPHAKALQQAAAGNVLGQVLDRNAGLDAANIGLGKDQLVEGNVLGGAQGDLRG